MKKLHNNSKPKLHNRIQNYIISGPPPPHLEAGGLRKSEKSSAASRGGDFYVVDVGLSDAVNVALDEGACAVLYQVICININGHLDDDIVGHSSHVSSSVC